MYSSRSDEAIHPVGLPHSDIFGSKLDCSSPKRFAAYRVLHQLFAPRHPPRALCSLNEKLPYYASYQSGPKAREVNRVLGRLRNSLFVKRTAAKLDSFAHKIIQRRSCYETRYVLDLRRVRLVTCFSSSPSFERD